MEFMRQYQCIAKFFSWLDRDKILVKLAYKIIFYFDLEQRASLAIPYGGHCGVAPCISCSCSAVCWIWPVRLVKGDDDLYASNVRRSNASSTQGSTSSHKDRRRKRRALWHKGVTQIQAKPCRTHHMLLEIFFRDVIDPVAYTKIIEFFRPNDTLK